MIPEDVIDEAYHAALRVLCESYISARMGGVSDAGEKLRSGLVLAAECRRYLRALVELKP